MRNLFVLLAVSLLAVSVVSCKSEEEKENEKAKATIVTQVSKAKELRIRGAVDGLQQALVYRDCRFDTITPGEITITRDGDKFIALLPSDTKVIMQKADGEFKIIDSYNFINRESSDALTLAEKTGLIVGGESDVEWRSALLDLWNNQGKGSFMYYLNQKYPDAKIGNLKTIAVKKKPVGSLYRVDVVYESGGYYDVTLNVRMFDKDGVQRSSKSKTVGARPKGERESVMFIFKTDAVGNVGKIDVDYSIYDYDNSDVSKLLKYAPLSKDDYKDYLAGKK